MAEMKVPREVRQGLVDLVAVVDWWISQYETLLAEHQKVQDQVQRLDMERLGLATRFQSTLMQNQAEWDAKREALEAEVQRLTQHARELEAAFADAQSRFAEVLESRPSSMADLTEQAVLLINEAKKMVREHL
jgi:cell division septum initiation protein DivIVA